MAPTPSPFPNPEAQALSPEPQTLSLKVQMKDVQKQWTKRAWVQPHVFTNIACEKGLGFKGLWCVI